MCFKSSVFFFLESGMKNISEVLSRTLDDPWRPAVIDHDEKASVCSLPEFPAQSNSPEHDVSLKVWIKADLPAGCRQMVTLNAALWVSCQCHTLGLYPLIIQLFTQLQRLSPWWEEMVFRQISNGSAGFQLQYKLMLPGAAECLASGVALRS